MPFRYSTDDHSGLTGAQLGQIENGKLVLFGQPLVTTDRARSPVKPYRGGHPPLACPYLSWGTTRSPSFSSLPSSAVKSFSAAISYTPTSPL